MKFIRYKPESLDLKLYKSYTCFGIVITYGEIKDDS